MTVITQGAGMGLRQSVALVGMMGCGKSVVGRHLAQLLGATFRDCDEAVETVAGCSISALFEQSGEARFRTLERRVLADILDGAPTILATGGGAYIDDVNRSLIDQKAIAVWINVSLGILKDRLSDDRERPLLRTDAPDETLARLMRSREPIYALAPIHAPVHPGETALETARGIARMLQQSGQLR